MEEEQKKRQEVEEEQRRRQEEEAWGLFLAEHVDEAHCCHEEKEQLKQVEMTRKEQLWGKAGEEVRGGSGMWRCDYCTKKGMACEWPPVGSKAHLCSQCREHKIPCVVGGKGNEKRKEQGRLENVAWKKSKTVDVAEKSALLKDATPVGLDMSQQLILELHIINRTLHAIHSTLKGVLYQIDPDWLEKEKKELSSEDKEEEELEKESEEGEGGEKLVSEEKGEEKLAKEENEGEGDPEGMTLDEEVVEKVEEAKGKAKEN